MAISNQSSDQYKIKLTTARKPLRVAARLRMLLGVVPAGKASPWINFCMISSQNHLR
jgi:hypothetical protein